MYRVKNTKRPPNPKNCTELRKFFEVPKNLEQYGYNQDNTERFYLDTIVANTYSFTIFASMSMIKIVRHNIHPKDRHYQMDGTFKVVPRLFYQLLVISIEFQNKVSRNKYN